VWNLVASPLSTQARSARDAFDALGGDFLQKWIAWRWNATQQRWEAAAPLEGSVLATEAFDAGIGWAVAAMSEDGSSAPESLPVNGQSTDAGGPYRLPLRTGWNLVGTPFDFPIAWSDASIRIAVGNSEVSPTAAATSGLVDNRLIYFDPVTQAYVTRFSNESSAPYSIDPGQAWWIFSSVDAAELVIPPVEAESVSTLAAAPALTARRPEPGGLWSVKFIATSGNRYDTVNIVAGGPAGGTLSLRHVKPPASPDRGRPRIAVVNPDSHHPAQWLTHSARALDTELAWSRR